MDLEQVKQSQSTITATEQDVATKPNLDSFLQFQDMIKSENDVAQVKLKGVKEVETGDFFSTNVFKEKENKKQAVVRNRLKIVTCVYVCVVVMLFGLIITNLVTQLALSKKIDANAKVIQSETTLVEYLQETNLEGNLDGEPVEVILNQPRDYSEDKQELTFLDKVTILFRNIFG